MSKTHRVGYVPPAPALPTLMRPGVKWNRDMEPRTACGIVLGGPGARAVTSLDFVGEAGGYTISQTPTCIICSGFHKMSHKIVKARPELAPLVRDRSREARLVFADVAEEMGHLRYAAWLRAQTTL